MNRQGRKRAGKINRDESIRCLDKWIATAINNVLAFVLAFVALFLIAALVGHVHQGALKRALTSAYFEA